MLVQSSPSPLQRDIMAVTLVKEETSIVIVGKSIGKRFSAQIVFVAREPTTSASKRSCVKLKANGRQPLTLPLMLKQRPFVFVAYEIARCIVWFQLAPSRGFEFCFP